MSLKLYVGNTNEPDEYDVCYGTCYGYNSGVHLYSLDYLIDIDAFKDWKFGSLFDKEIYTDMISYFECEMCTDPIYLTKGEYERFISLYLSDYMAIWGKPCTPYGYDENPDEFVPNDNLNVIRICWCGL